MSSPSTSAAFTPEVSALLAAADADALAALARAGGDKALRKAAKRALHLLKLRGITPTPERATALPTAMSEPTPAAESTEPARVTAISGAGQRLVFLPVKAATGFALHTFVVSEAEGIREVDTVELSRKQLRASLSRLTEQAPDVVREITQARGIGIALEALARTARSPAAIKAMQILRTVPASDPEFGVANLARPEPAQATGALESSAELFDRPPVSEYFPSREALAALEARLGEVAVSPLYVDERQRAAQLRHTIERSIADYFDPVTRRRFALRLADAAELFDDQGEASSAAQARAVATALLEERDALQIPFARALFERLLQPAATAGADSRRGRIAVAK